LDINDYHPSADYLSPVSITVDQTFAMSAGSELRLQLGSLDWGSTISFAKAIPVTLDGKLDLEFASDVDLKNQLGRTFDLFDWTSVTPDGHFTIDSPYVWDVSRLYSTGEVTLQAVPEPSGLQLALVGIIAILYCVARCPIGRVATAVID
jgi:hypothetical protein